MSASHFGRTVPSRLIAITGVGLLAVLGACSDDDDGAVADDSGSGSTVAEASDSDSETNGTLVDAADGGDAVSYDPELAPLGAELTVAIEEGDEATTVDLEVVGLMADRGYAVHLHTMPCGATGDAAGPHFQHDEDPAAGPGTPSVDPEYANPDNEIWLDIETDADGAGSSDAEVPFVLAGGAKSVVVHMAEMTATAEGEAGSAGDRVACMTLGS